MLRNANCYTPIVSLCCSLEASTFEIIVLLTGALPNSKLQTSVLSIWLVFSINSLGTILLYVIDIIIIIII